MMHLGSAWYPEHWPRERWDEDIRLMREGNFTVVRVAEFAWSSMEPTEGDYRFDWLEQAIELAAEYGLKTVICTPSATPPAWLTSKYPETLRWESRSMRTTHGARCHGRPTSAKYRELCKGITAKMVERFGQNPNVIGWQTDNELHMMSFDEETRGQFHDWLKARYGTIEALNADWVTSYWSQSYNDFSQIELPESIPAAGYDTVQSPNLIFAFREFFSDVYRDFQKDQIDIIRAGVPEGVWVTHNFCPAYDQDREIMAADLDFASWDSYMTERGLDPAITGFDVGLIRGLKQRNIWIMETQPSFIQWKPPNIAMGPGRTRTAAWHMVGQGADAVLYWQWRAAPSGQEIYHGTIADASGQPRPVYDELKQLGDDFARVGTALSQTEPVAEVALLHDMRTHWAIEDCRFNPDYGHLDVNYSWFGAIRDKGVMVDVVPSHVDFSKYRVVVCPHLHLVDDTLVTKITEYVEAGGHVLVGPRSGYKDFRNRQLLSRQPGPLAELLGGEVVEFYSIDGELGVTGEGSLKGMGLQTTRVWGEMLQTLNEDCEILLRYADGHAWLSGHPALLRRRVGEGSFSYLGTWLSDNCLSNLMKLWFDEAHVNRPLGTLPKGVEVSHRASWSDDYYILMNHNTETVAVPLKQTMTDQLSGETMDMAILEPGAVFVLKTVD